MFLACVLIKIVMAYCLWFSLNIWGSVYACAFWKILNRLIWLRFSLKKNINYWLIPAFILKIWNIWGVVYAYNFFLKRFGICHLMSAIYMLNNIPWILWMACDIDNIIYRPMNWWLRFCQVGIHARSIKQIDSHVLSNLVNLRWGIEWYLDFLWFGSERLHLKSILDFPSHMLTLFAFPLQLEYS